MSSRFGWTLSEDRTLAQMWARGLTAALIGERLGKSRDAILGRIRRLGLNRQSSASTSLTGGFSRQDASR
jgi:hypothetical protein